ncbi:MAG: DNA translocase FtsK 4TM domain-containing protein [Desulfobacterales bacterium]|nr:DNA translocase FtsK 4TM domain-containing protein [Desulfobacterales bacterium]
MRKEIFRILLIFLVILITLSLLSYDASDPSINNVVSTDKVKNIFGLLGAYLSGSLIGLLGLGAFWIPIIVSISIIKVIKNYPFKSLFKTVLGGFILAIFTGTFLAFLKKSYLIAGKNFDAGGMIGFSAKSFLICYTNFFGGITIAVFFLAMGFTIFTGVPMSSFFSYCIQIPSFCIKRIKPRLIKIVESISAKFSSIKEEVKQISISKPKKNAPQKPKNKTEKTINDSDNDDEKNANIENNDNNEPKTQVPILDPPIKHDYDEIPNIRIAKVQKINESKPENKVKKQTQETSGFTLPDIDFLKDPVKTETVIDEEYLKKQSELLEKKLEDFGVKGKVVAINPGPVITTFEYSPAPGIKINKIVNLSDDLALALKAIGIRIVAPIPGKDVIGVEIPNKTRQFVFLKEIIVSREFEKSNSKLTLCLGKDISGKPVVSSLDKMPHLLIAGATGTGKSVALNTMIISLVYKSTPEDVKLIMIDPKRIELSVYNGIPHLITPVVTDMKKATNALFWAVKEMEKRYQLLEEKKTRNITQYNDRIAKEFKESQKEDDNHKKLPYVVIIIDELADLMMVASKDVEVALTRLAQMARASGIHIILATQRPSVDVLTGIIKANFPTRLSFQVSSKVDSRTIIDTSGAEHLLGSGDMLFLPPGTGKLKRIHGAYISEEETQNIIEFLKLQKEPEYDEMITEATSENDEELNEEEYDVKYKEALELVRKTRQASTSMIQRHLRIGYNRAARIIEIMEKNNVVGPSDGVKPREVLIPNYDE